MSSPSKASALLPAGRGKWLWLAVAGALGLWLIILLVLGGPDDAAKRKRPAKTTPYDSATEAFSKRLPVKSTRPSAPFPVPPDQGQGK